MQPQLNQSTSIQDQNLDRLHVQWVLGKNRGNPQPLKPNDLRLLVNNNIISESQLSDEEKNQLTQEVIQLEPEVVVNQLNNKNNSGQISNIVNMIVDSIKQEFVKQYRQYHEDAWKELTSHEQNLIAEKLLTDAKGKNSQQLKEYYLSLYT